MSDTHHVQQPSTGMRWFMVPAVIIYVAAVSLFLVWRGISVSPDYFVFVLLFGAIILGRWKAFLVDWLPFVALFLGYEFLRGLAGSSGIAVHYDGVIRADALIGGGSVPTLFLQQSLYQPGRVSVLDITSTFFYFLHFAYPLTLGYLFWLLDRSLYRRFAAALLAMSFVAFVFFLLVPVAPPWYAAGHGHLAHVEKIINHTLPSYVSPFYDHLNPNPVAAMPSLHEAFPVLGMLFGFKLFGRWAWVLAAWCLAVCFSIVYLGEHYLVDALAGAGLAAVAFVAAELVWARVGSGRRSVEPGEADARLPVVETVDA